MYSLNRKFQEQLTMASSRTDNTPQNSQASQFSKSDKDKQDPKNDLPISSLSLQNNSGSGSVLNIRPINEENWQCTRNKLMERLNFLLFNRIMADVTFIVGSQKEHIPAHKFILSIGSTVFEAMFYSMLATKSDEIEIPDVEPTAFRNVLKFLYTDKAPIEPDTVMTTLYTAKKYAVPALEEQCVKFLENSLNTDNAFLLLSQARLFDVLRLITQCLDTIDKHTQACISSDCFLDIDNNTLQAVLARDTLRIREITLYEAVIRWSEAECHRNNSAVNADNQRIVLKDCARLIRYPLMTSQEFAAGPAQDGLLTDKQMVQLFLYFNLNPKPTSEFSDRPRCCMTGRETVCSRFLEVESRWGYSGASDRIRFQVDQRIFVAGYGLYGSIHGPSEYDVDIELVHTATNTTVASNKTKFNCDGSNRPFRVLFKEPVEVLPHTSYCAVATIKGRDSFYGTKGLQKLTLQCKSDVHRVTFQFSFANGINNGTSVEDGQIPEIIFYT